MRIILTFFLAFVLTACGFKGALYLPDPAAPPKKTRKQQAQPTQQQTHPASNADIASHAASHHIFAKESNAS